MCTDTSLSPKVGAHLYFYLVAVIMDCSILFPFFFFQLTFHFFLMFKGLNLNLENETILL